MGSEPTSSVGVFCEFPSSDVCDSESDEFSLLDSCELEEVELVESGIEGEELPSCEDESDEELF